MSTQRTALLDFGAFPGASDASIAITGQAGILANSFVEAWISPAATADHTADEHLVETLKVMAGNIVAGVGFTIYGINTSEINQPLEPHKGEVFRPGGRGGVGMRLYGKWNISWVWV